ESAREIAVPVLMATITTAVVFFPLSFMTGMGKHLFTPLAASATMALAASYLVSRTVSPLFCSKFLRAQEEETRFPRWLLVSAAVIGVVGLGIPALAHYGAGFLDKHFPREIGDLIAAPYRALPALARRGLVAIGVLGAAVVVLAGCSRLARPFQRL